MNVSKMLFYFKGQVVDLFFKSTPLNPEEGTANGIKGYLIDADDEFVYLSGDKEGKDNPVVALNKSAIRTIQSERRDLKYEVNDEDGFDVVDYISNIDDDKDIQ